MTSVRSAPSTSQQVRRDRIVAAALGLLQDREYDKVQIRDVADEAGVALATLYRYFPSKEQLFAHALLEWSRSPDTTVRRRGASAPPRERLAVLMRRTATAFERHPHYFRLITVLENVKDPAVRAPFQAYSRRFLDVVHEALDGLAPEDVETITVLVVSLLSAEMRRWSVGAATMPEVRQNLDHAVDVIFREPRLAAPH